MEALRKHKSMSKFSSILTLLLFPLFLPLAIAAILKTAHVGEIDSNSLT